MKTKTGTVNSPYSVSDSQHLPRVGIAIGNAKKVSVVIFPPHFATAAEHLMVDSK